MSEQDWLNDNSAETTDENFKKALEHANLYLVFEMDPRAKRLLESWVKHIEQDIDPAAPHSVYAWHEGRRTFVRGIQRQMEFAKTGGGLNE